MVEFMTFYEFVNFDELGKIYSATINF